MTKSRRPSARVACIDNKCNKTFNKRGRMLEHVEFVHRGGGVLCTVRGCNAVLASKEGIKRHINQRHALIKYPCTICGIKYVDRYRMLQHVKRVHQGVPNKTVTCHLCQRVYQRKEALANHVNVSHNRIRYRCMHDECMAEYTARDALYQHINSVHKKVTMKCHHCCKMYKSVARYNAHFIQDRDRCMWSISLDERREERSRRKRRRKVTGSVDADLVFDKHHCVFTACSKSYVYMTSLYRHMRKIHANSKFEGFNMDDEELMEAMNEVGDAVADILMK